MGREKAHDEIFCRTCGEPIKKKAEICPECGVRNEYTEPQTPQQPKEQATSQTSDSRSTTQSTSTQSASSGSVPHDPSRFTTSVSDNWHYGVAASVALWILGFIPPDAIGGLMFMVAWVLMPVSIYYDRQWVRATSHWNPNLALWVILSILPLFNIVAGVVYLVRRYNLDPISEPGRTATDSVDDPEDEALARLRTRYSDGELSDEEFEEKLEQLLSTEDRETAASYIERQKQQAAPADDNSG